MISMLSCSASIGLENPKGTVGRAIIGDAHEDLDALLAQDAIELLGKVLLAVVGGHENEHTCDAVMTPLSSCVAQLASWRRDRDSNPGGGSAPPDGFQDRCIQPLCHPSACGAHRCILHQTNARAPIRPLRIYAKSEPTVSLRYAAILGSFMAWATFAAIHEEPCPCHIHRADR